MIDKNNKQASSWLYYSYPKGINLEERKDQLSHFLDTEELLRWQFESIHACCNSRETVLIPSEFYEESLAQEAFRLQYGYVENPKVQTENVLNGDACLAYTAQDTALNTWIQKFPMSIVHHASALQLQASKFEGNSIQCFISANWLKVIAIKDGALQVMQQFAYQAPSDAAYHLLNTCRQTGLEPASDDLILYGLVDQDSAMYLEMYKYFLNIRFNKDIEPFTLGGELELIPLQYYSAGIQMAKCVL